MNKERNDIMKKIFSIILAALICLSSCTEKNRNLSEIQIEYSHKNTEESQHISEYPPQSYKENNSDENLQSSEKFINEEDITKCFEDLDYLLSSSQWHNPEEIKVDSYIIWYNYRLKRLHKNDENYIDKYKVNGKEGLFFPAGELEKEIKNFFDISSDYLRKSDLYNSNSKTYRLPDEFEPLDNKIYKITNTYKDADKTFIDYTLTYPLSGKIYNMTLTLKSVEGSVKFFANTLRENKIITEISDDDKQMLFDEYIKYYYLSKLMYCSPWDNANELPAENLVRFYQYKRLEEYLNGIAVKIKNGKVSVPEKEVESYIINFFDVNTTHLRTSALYNCETYSYEFEFPYKTATGQGVDIIQLEGDDNIWEFTLSDMENKIFKVKIEFFSSNDFLYTDGK